MRAYTREEMDQYWIGYHTARLRYDEGGAAYARVCLEDVKERKPKRYRDGYARYMKQARRDHEYSERALLEHL